MCSIVYEPCDENSFKIGPPILSGKFAAHISYCCIFYVNFDFSRTADDAVEGSGDDGTDGGSQLVSMDTFRECTDRVMMPCDFEEFITVSEPAGLLLFPDIAVKPKLVIGTCAFSLFYARRS
jgi:hypothetical protein